MRVLLVEPPFQRFMGFKCDWFPLGLGYLGAALLQEGHKVKIYNAEFHRQQEYLSSSRLLKTYDRYTQGLQDPAHPIWREARDVLAAFKPDLVGITARTVKFASALKLASLVKEYRQDLPVVLGGQHPTILTDEVLAHPEIDYVARGEGEQTLVELVAALAAKTEVAGIAGLSYKTDGQLRHSLARELIADLDSVPFPAREALWDKEHYEGEAMGNLFTSRGCPFRCGYCSSHLIWTRKVRYRSVPNILAEIRQVRETYGTEEFTFWDDSFTVHKGRVHELCDALIKEKLGISWGCTTRFDLIDEEMIKRMKRAGCNNVELGVESGSPPVLEFMDKDLTLDRMRGVARLLNKQGLYWSAFFMVGLPNETEEDIRATLRFMKELKPKWSTYSIFTPYPGTKLYQASLEMGLIPPQMDWSQYGHQSPHNLFTAHMSAETMADMVALSSREFDRYNRQPRLLLEKALSRGRLYRHHPGLVLADARKLLNWLGLLKKA